MLAAKPLVSSKPSSSKRAARQQVAVRASADGKYDDYKPTRAIFFPGQGAQSVGMCKSLVEEVPRAAEMFDTASDILGYDLLKKCVEGPAEELNTTEISQPAIYVASLAAVEKLKLEKGADFVDGVDVTCGLSLGEYTALAFAGAFSFEDGLKLVATRGKAMQAAADAAPSAMASVIGLDSAKVEELCAAANAEVDPDQAVQIANFLCPGNYAVSGGVAGIEKVAEMAKPQFKARMAVKLAVAGAFHTQFMQPAVGQLEEALAATAISEPRLPVISNVDAKPHADPEEIRKILARQVVGPVLWENTLKELFARGLTEGYECGPGKVISGIAKRIDKGVSVTNVEA
ncbi:unnamed protein product [Pedinophyceae sp. YPF-701]|nr:unnamed protein product [Pedinophyceae sp. YPF-701]